MKNLLLLLILTFSINLSAQYVPKPKHSYKTMNSVMKAKYKEIPDSTKLGFGIFVLGSIIHSTTNFKGSSNLSKSIMIVGVSIVTFDIVTKKKKKPRKKVYF